MAIRHDEILRNDALRVALESAVRGAPAKFFGELTRHGRMPGPRPNLDLAIAVGANLATRDEPVIPLALQMADIDVDVDAPELFLSMVAAYVIVARIRAGKEAKSGWQLLFEMTDDERGQVRLAIIDALSRDARQGNADALLVSLEPWMNKFSSTAIVLDVFSEHHVVTQIHNAEAFIARLDDAVRVIEDAPRAAERQLPYRRMIDAFPRVISAAAPSVRGVREWALERAQSPNRVLRAAFETVIAHLRKDGQAMSTFIAVGKTLDDNAPPRRDPTAAKVGTRKRGRKARRRS